MLSQKWAAYPAQDAPACAERRTRTAEMRTVAVKYVLVKTVHVVQHVNAEQSRTH